MAEISLIAREIFEEQRDQVTAGLSTDQVGAVEEAFLPWIQAKLEQYDPDIYSQDAYVSDIIPGEINFLFDDLDPEGRFEKALTAYHQLRVHLLNETTYERAREFIHQQGDPGQQKASAEDDLRELKQLEGHLSKEHPAVYKKVKRQISESKLDCLYIIRDGGAASLRLGREINRLG